MRDNKKIIVLRVLQILEQYSSIDMPLTCNQILTYLLTDYNIDCERKAVFNNMNILRDSGYDISTTKKGSYLASKEFEPSEIKLLIDSVLCSSHINMRYTKDLINKLCSLGGSSFDNIKKLEVSKHWNKIENYDFLLNIETLAQAISSNNQVEFFYNQYDYDIKLHHTRNVKHLINPYNTFMHNQHYFLLGNNDKYDSLAFFRLDKITDINILPTSRKSIASIPGYENSVHLDTLSCSLPYLYNDNIISVKLKCSKSVLNDFIDWFGKERTFIEKNDDYFITTIKTSEKTIVYWALQYSCNVEILAPDSLRKLMKTTSEQINKIY